MMLPRRKKSNEPLLMNVLCRLDRPMIMGGRVMILLDGVSGGFLPFGIYVLGENNNNP